MPGMDMPGDTKTNDSKVTSGTAKPDEPNSKDNKSMPGMDMPDDPKPTTNTSPSENTISQTAKHSMIKVSGNCDLCKDRIETAAKSVSGVSSADWSSETKMLQVQFDAARTNSDAIEKAIARVGHDTEKIKAPDNIYQELPECCLYRE
jgi:Cu(I)/Ag(I) efflux system membrane fusion protein